MDELKLSLKIPSAQLHPDNILFSMTGSYAWEQELLRNFDTDASFKGIMFISATQLLTLKN
jgi:hypothetical protein